MHTTDPAKGLGCGRWEPNVAKAVVNGVADHTAEVTKSMKSAKTSEMPTISSTARDDVPASTSGEASDPGTGSRVTREPAEASPAASSSAVGDPTATASAATPAAPGTGDPATGPSDAENSLDEEPDDEADWADDYQDAALFTSIFSAPSLALTGFVFALTGLLGGMIPESLPYLVQIDPTLGPAYHLRIVGLIALGFAIIAASLGLAAMLRSICSPLRWPRYLGGAAVLLALLIALQAVLLIGLAGVSGPPGMN